MNKPSSSSQARAGVFVTTAVYALGRQLGMAGALQEFTRQLEKPGKDSLPVVRTIYRIRHLTDIGLHVDCGATIIGHMRSRAFHAAYESAWNGWISLDDDIDVTTETCTAMLDAIHLDAGPRIIVVPYMMRTPETIHPKMSLTFPKVRIEREWNGARFLRLPPGEGAGFGMVGMNRAAMEAIVAAAPADLRWIDGDGDKKLALFRDELVNGFWYGEDTSFFRRVPATVTVEALLTGHVVHGGITTQLSKL